MNEGTSLSTIKRLASLFVAGAAALATFPSYSATVTLNGSSGCTYSGWTVDANGNLAVNCGTANPAGTISFLGAPYSVNVGQSTTATLQRTGGSTGSVSVSVSASGGCGLTTTGSLNWPNADANNRTVGVQGNAIGACTLNFVGDQSGNAVVNVADPTNPGAFVLSGSTTTTTGAAASSVTIQRTGGSNGNYAVAYTATPSGLTGFSVTPASPITFASGESSKVLTVTPGSTTGTLTLQLGAAAPVTPTTIAANGSSGTHTVTVQNPGTCGTPPANLVMGAFGAEGNWQTAYATTQNMPSGQIQSFPLPFPMPTGANGGVITISQTAITPNGGTIEATFSQCPGDMSVFWPQGNVAPDYTPCRLVTSNYAGSSLQWHLSGQGFANYCYMPNSNGPYYFNIRLTYPSCNWSSCGLSIQWNRL